MQKNFTHFISAVTRARNHTALIASFLLFMLLLLAKSASAQTISTLNPSCTTVSNTDLSLVITGSNFRTGSGNTRVKVNGAELAGTNVTVTSNSQINVTLPASFVSQAGSLSIVVETRGTGNNSSNWTASSPAILTVAATTSTYSVINRADPFPICKGQNTLYTAYVYRDVLIVDVRDPRHPQYSEWAGMANSDFRKISYYRYWQPDVVRLDGKPATLADPETVKDLLVPEVYGSNGQPTRFDYDWIRNGTSLQSNSQTTRQAGLSATDVYYVKVSLKNGQSLCGTFTTPKEQDLVQADKDANPRVQAPVPGESNHLWYSTPPTYTFNLTASKNPVCPGEQVTFTATADYGGLVLTGLKLYFYKNVGGTLVQLNAQPITTSPATITLTATSAATSTDPTVFSNGDVISVGWVTDQVKCLTQGTNESQVTMTVNTVPTLTAAPEALTVCAGQLASFTVTATGTGLTYQWFKNDVAIPGATASTLSFASAQASDAANYSVRIIGTCAPEIRTTAVSLTVNALPAITSQPVATTTVCEGGDVSFSVSATGTNITYQWYKNNVAINGATSNTYAITGVTLAQAGDYTVKVTGTCAPVATSQVAKLTVNELLRISSAPVASTLCEGGTATFTVAATGTGLTYQWLKGGQIITGATGTSLTINPVTTADAGDYSVQITAACSTATTTPMALTVNILPRITATLPTTTTICENGSTTLSVQATGTGLTFSWSKGSTAITAGITTSTSNGVTTSTLQLSNVQVADAGTYSVQVSGSCNSPQTAATQLVVNTPLAVSVARPAAVCEGTSTILSATVTGSGNLQYQWYKRTDEGTTTLNNSTIYNGVTTASLTITNAVYGNSDVYYLTVSGGLCNPASLTSNEVILPVTKRQNHTVVIEGDDEPKVGESTQYFAVTLFGSQKVTPPVPATYLWTITIFDGKGPQGGPSVKEYSASNSVDGITIEGNSLTIASVPEENMVLKVKETLINTSLCVDDLVATSDNSTIDPLPVELLYLTAEKKGNNIVALEWATAIEQNSEGFEVQVSQDAKTYRTLAFVNSKAGGNTNKKQVYAFYDKENGKYGTRYYRLKQRDMNGDFEYFGPKAVKLGEAAASLSAYPNPFTSAVTLEFNAPEAGNMHVLVTNAVGTKVLERTWKVEKGSNQQSLQLNSSLPQGVYIITTRLNGQTSHLKLVKQQ
jgi:hypothetical protein